MKRDFWERASVRANTRPDRLPVRTTTDDFLLQPGPGSVRMFLECGLASCGIAVFFVLLPLVIFVAITPVESLGSWPWLAAGVAFAGSWAGLFGAAVREAENDRRWAED